MTRYSLIVLSYNSDDYLSRCLDALFAQGGDAEIILADNASRGFDAGRWRRQYPRLRVIETGGNLGFAAGNNLAARAASGEWLGFINPDAFVETGWMNAIDTATRHHPRATMIASVQLDAEQPDHFDGAGDAVSFFGFSYRMGFGRPVQALEDTGVFCPCGAAFVMRRDVFERLGGFEESFFNYVEDADLGFRARLQGEVCVLAAAARIRHIGSATLGTRSDFALYHGYRNRLWFYLRTMPLGLLLPTLPVHLALTLALALNDAIKGRGHVVVRALGDALKALPAVLAARAHIQHDRRVKTLRLAKDLTWNPRTIARRDLDHKALP